MIQKYTQGYIPRALKIKTLLLFLVFVSLGSLISIHATNPNQPVKAKSSVSIINPGLDPVITLSSNTATLFAAANSTGVVSVTSNTTWSASSDQSWLVVSPVSGTGNGTLTFTADANVGAASRNATVTVRGTGLADQTIVVKQLGEIPSLSFTPSSSGTVSVFLQFNAAGSFYIDWGNGTQVLEPATTIGDTYTTSSYVSGHNIKIYGTGFTKMTAVSMNLTSVDVSQCPEMSYLDLSHNSLPMLDVSSNTKLTYLDCSYNSLGFIDVSNNSKLTELRLAYNNLGTLDVSNNSVLTYLDCSSNKITQLNMRYLTTLIKLYCNSNKLNTLDVSGNTSLSLLFCNQNNFDFVTLPQRKALYSPYNYAPQSKIPATVNGNIIDLRGQFSTNDINNIPQTTAYKWFTKPGVQLVAGTDYKENNGVFTFQKTPADSIYCAMTNSAFPLFTGLNALRTVNVKVQLNLPQVNTLDVVQSNVGSTQAIVGGDLINFGIPDPTNYGVCWNTMPNPLITDSKIDLLVPSSTGVYPVTMAGLTPYTLYYIRAFATNLAGTAYGVEKTFMTDGIRPSLNTDSIRNVRITKATGYGNITNLGAPNPSQYGFVWSTSPAPTVDLATKTSQGPVAVIGTFISDITGLLPNTTYYGRAYATNIVGTNYGQEVTFTTLTPVITTPVPTSLSGFTTTIGTASTPSKTFVVGGVLSQDLVVTAPAGYEVRESGIGIFGNSVTLTPDASEVLSDKTIEVRIAVTAPLGPVTGDVVCSSAGAVSKYVTLDGMVYPVQLTVSPPTVTPSKPYDGNVLAAFTPGTLAGIMGTDDVSLDLLATTSTYPDPNAAIGKTITIHYILKGIDAGKYIPPVDFTVLGDITQAPLTVTAVTDTKVYNGTTASAGMPTIVGLISGDAANISPIQVYDTPNAGTTHILTASGLTLKNAANADVTANYLITYVNSPATGEISQLGVTVTGVTDTKTYDGTTGSVGIPVIGSLLAGDVMNIAPIQVFDTPEIGNTHVLIASGLTIKNAGNDDVTANYLITYINSPATGVIDKLVVTVTAVPTTKIYDATTVSAGSPIVGSLAPGDVIDDSPIQVYDNPNYGITHVMTPSGLTIENGSGVDVTANYTISYLNSQPTGVINKFDVTVTAVTDTKPYDGTTASSAHPIVGLLLGTDVMNISPIQVFDNLNAGTTHVLTASGLTIKNAADFDVSDNYAVTYVNSLATGVINPLALIVTAVTDTKSYDGTVTSSAYPIVGSLVLGDAVNVAPVQVFDMPVFGTTHVLTASGLTIKNGNNADVTANYTITYVSSPATGVISKYHVDVTAVTDTKVFDGTVASSLSPIVGTLPAGDVVKIAPIQVFDTPVVGITHILTPSGLTITNASNADVTANYTINYISSPATGVIFKLDVTVTGVPDTKTYDGTTASSAHPLVGALAPGDVIDVAPLQVYDTPDAGTTHLLIPSGLTIKNGSNVDVTANYTITYANSLATGVINKFDVTVTGVTDTKTYDGTTVSAGLPVTGLLLAGNSIKVQPTQVYDAPGYGLTHVLIPSGLTIKDGSNADVTGNYTITYVNSAATGVINKMAIAVTAVTDTKTYDGTTASTGIPQHGITAPGDAVNTTPAQVYDAPGIGTTHVLIPSGLTLKDGSNADVTGNYTITYINSPATGVINKLDVTVTAVTDTKTYNATISSAAAPLVGVLANGDAVGTAPIQVYDTPSIGITHVLTTSGLTIKDGSNVDVTGNYIIHYVNSPATGIINAMNVTVTGVMDIKTYDGTKTSAGIPVVGALAFGDVVNAAPIELFDTSNAGITHILIPSGLTIKDGSNADVTANYAITYVNSPATGVINKLGVTVTGVTDSRIYDGTSNSSGVPLVGALLAGEVVNKAPNQSFDTPGVGTTHILIPFGMTIKDAGNNDVTANYAINYVNSPATGVISALGITVTAVTDTKTYDGTISSAASPIVGTLASGDVVNVAPVQVFDTPATGTTHILTPSGLTLKDAGNANVTGNYTITYVNSPATGVINKLVVNVNAVTDTKFYDATVSSTASPVVGPLGTGDVVNTAPVQVFDSPVIGNTHVLTASGLTIKNGANADVSGNYTILYVNSPATGIINKLPLTVTAVTDTKTYNGTTVSAGAPVVGVLFAGDAVSIAPIQVYDTPDAGTTHVLIASGLTVKDGSNADVTGNYAITYVNSPATGVINKLAVTVTAVTDTKIYDGNKSSVGSPIVGLLLAGEVVSIAPSQVFDTPDIGNTHVLIPSGMVIVNGSNVDVTHNYAINYVNSPATGIISKKNLTVTAITDTKIYDGTTASTAIPLMTPLAVTDVVNTAPVQVFDSPFIGNTHILSASGLTIKDASNADVTGNYSITYVNSPATGVIDKLVVTVTAVPDTKTYDATVNSAVIPLIGLLGIGDVPNTVPIQVYDTPNAGTTHVLIPSGFSVKNASNVDVSANYTIVYVNSPATGIINKRDVTVNAVTDTRTYNATVTSAGIPVVGLLLAGDFVLAAPIQVYDTPDAGTTHVLIASGLIIKDGSNADVTANYAINYINSPATGVIHPFDVTVTAVTDTKTYDGNTGSAGIPLIGALLTGQVVKAAPVQVFDSPVIGLAHTLIASGLAIQDISNMDVTHNYAVTYVNSPATGVINKLNLTVTAVTDSKIYDGTINSLVAPLIGALALSDVVNTAPVQVFDSPFVGNTHALTASGLTIKDGNNADVTGNYNITYVSSPATGVINKLTVTVTAVSDTRTYDATLNSAIIPVIGALATGDVPNTVPVQVYDSPNAGTTHVLTPSGLSVKNGSNVDVSTNYTINYVKSPATGIINKFTVSVTAVTDTKTYDATVTSASVPVVGLLLAGQLVNVAPTQVYDTRDAGTSHILIPSGLTVKDGGNVDVSANYSITYINSPATGVINTYPVTVTAVTDTKTYDGNRVSAGIPVVGALLAGEVVSAAPKQVFDNPVAGITHTLIAFGLTIKNGSNANVTANYAVSYVNSPTTGVINKLGLIVTGITDSKIYNASVNSSVVPLVGALALGDGVRTIPVQVFDTPKAGNKHVLIPSGLTIKDGSNADATSNYAISYVSSPATGVITAKALTVTDPVLTTHKVVDGNTNAAVTQGMLSGVEPSDISNVTITATATYDDATVGINKTITVVYGLTGSAAGNYIAPSNYVFTTGLISAKNLSITSPTVTLSKEYDGTPSVVFTPGVLTGVDPFDAPNVSLTATASYDNATVGIGKTITIKYGLIGSLAGNYIAPPDYVVTTGVITSKPLVVLTLKITTSKVYDGTTGATFTINDLTGVLPADIGNVILTGTATYDNTNAGTGKNITVTLIISGSAAGNYTAPSSYTITNGEILAKKLTIADPVVVTNKMVDGNTEAVITTLGTLQGVLASDANNVGFTAAANYDTKNVGVNKTITVVYTLNGTAIGNYIAPVDVVIPGAKISDNVTLSPIATPTNGCEGTSVDVAYDILTGTPTQYKITFGATAIAAGIQDVSYTNLPSTSASGILPVIIPVGTVDGVYQGTLQFRNELGVESPVYDFQFTINVSTDYIISKFDDVVLIDNSSKRFVGYQWYKDGLAVHGATKQFYNDLDGLVGAYSAKLTTVDGQTLYTCPKILNIPLAKNVSVFPSPVKRNQVSTIKLTGMTDTELDGADLSVYTMQGTRVYQSSHVQKVNSINLPPIAGMYVGRVTTSRGQELQFKVIVIE